MFGGDQIVWNSKHKKPEVHHDLKPGPDTYLSEYFGSWFPKYIQRHFVKVDDPNQKPYCPGSIEQAQELLDKGIIKPAEMADSHTPCCGVWKDRNHAFWCDQGTQEKRDGVIEHHETEKLKAYWNKCVMRTKRSHIMQILKNAKEFIELVQSVGPNEYGYTPTMEDLQFCGKLHSIMETAPRIEKFESWDCDDPRDPKSEEE
jgi:hypothetical protein